MIDKSSLISSCFMDGQSLSHGGNALKFTICVISLFQWTEYCKSVWEDGKHGCLCSRPLLLPTKAYHREFHEDRLTTSGVGRTTTTTMTTTSVRCRGSSAFSFFSDDHCWGRCLYHTAWRIIILIDRRITGFFFSQSSHLLLFLAVQIWLISVNYGQQQLKGDVWARGFITSLFLLLVNKADESCELPIFTAGHNT